MYEDDDDQDILHPWEIQEILIETLDEMESLQDEQIGEDNIDEFEDTLEDQEINIIHMSQDPISSALHPLRHRDQLINALISEIRHSSDTLGHMDGGSMATTTDKKELLFDLVPISTAPKLRVADSRSHTPTHIGKIYVQTSIQSEPIATKCFYTPSMPVTIISPSSITSSLHGTGYSARANLSGENCEVIFHKQQERHDLRVPCLLKKGLLFATILNPSDIDKTSVIASDTPILQVSSNDPLSEQQQNDTSSEDISDDLSQLRQLWHQRLNHINFCTLGDIHKYNKGVPRLGKPHPLDKCATCMQEK